jgi:hypothetical protein
MGRSPRLNWCWMYLPNTAGGARLGRGHKISLLPVNALVRQKDMSPSYEVAGNAGPARHDS